MLFSTDSGTAQLSTEDNVKTIEYLWILWISSIALQEAYCPPGNCVVPDDRASSTDGCVVSDDKESSTDGCVVSDDKESSSDGCVVSDDKESSTDGGGV